MSHGTYPKQLGSRLAIAAVLILLVGLIVYRFQAPPEPIWKDEPFSHWVMDSYSSDPNIVAHAKRGFAEIAPEASIYLLHHISRGDSRLLDVFNRLLSDLPGSLQIPNDRSDPRNGAVAGFRAMGPLAKSAIPQLEKLLLDEDIAYEVGVALANVGGSDSVPGFCAALTNGTDRVRVGALEAMFELGTNGAAALPTVLALSNSTNLDVQLRALHLLGVAGKYQPDRVLLVLHNSIKTLPHQYLLSPLLGLGELGPSARTAVPDVLNLITNASYINSMGSIRRSTATKALVKILGNDALPHLLQMLSHDDVTIAAIAISELGALGTKAAPAVPFLLPFTTNQPDYVIGIAIHALGKIKTHPELVVPALIPKLTHTNDLISISSALVLGLYGTNAQSAVPSLTRLAETSSLSISYHDQWVRERFGLLNGEARKPFLFALEQIDVKAAATVQIQSKQEFHEN